MISDRPLSTAALPLLAGMAACSPTPDDGAPQAERIMLAQALAEAPEDDCLLMVWSNQKTQDVEFDRAHDRADGGAISCATGTSASRFESAIADLRAAARKRDKAGLLKQLGMPLVYIDAKGDSRRLKDPQAIAAAFDEVFDAQMLDLLAGLDLKDMKVAKGQGGFFALGSVWLVVDKDGGRPRLVTVNRQALNEALAAARRTGR